MTFLKVIFVCYASLTAAKNAIRLTTVSKESPHDFAESELNPFVDAVTPHRISHGPEFIARTVPSPNTLYRAINRVISEEAPNTPDEIYDGNYTGQFYQKVLEEAQDTSETDHVLMSGKAQSSPDKIYDANYTGQVFHLMSGDERNTAKTDYVMPEEAQTTPNKIYNGNYTGQIFHEMSGEARDMTETDHVLPEEAQNLSDKIHDGNYIGQFYHVTPEEARDSMETIPAGIRTWSQNLETGYDGEYEDWSWIGKTIWDDNLTDESYRNALEIESSILAAVLEGTSGKGTT